MPSWTTSYHDELKAEFDRVTGGMRDRLAQVTPARTTPALDSLTIGSAREMSATVLFFDIEGSTARTPNAAPAHLARTLVALNCVVPMMSRAITDYGGYIEKNTGDGLMAIFGPSESSADNALDAAITCFYLLREFVNPYLTHHSIEGVNARIGIDHGDIYVARIGLPTGRADNQRNFLTAIGPAANIACRLQEMAGANGICVGASACVRAADWRQRYFQAFIPPGEWPWVFMDTRKPYWVWKYTEQRIAPIDWFKIFASYGS